MASDSQAQVAIKIIRKPTAEAAEVMRRTAQAVVDSDAPTPRELLLANWVLDLLPPAPQSMEARQTLVVDPVAGTVDG